MSFASTARISTLVASAALAVGLGACGGSDSGSSSSAHTYPAAVESSFVKTCDATATASASGKLTAAKADTYCRAALKCTEKKLSVSQLETVTKNMTDGKANPDAKVLTDCAKQSAADLK